MVTVFVPDIPEFGKLLAAARRVADCEVCAPVRGYFRISAPNELCFVRKELGLGPALWNSALSGGFLGRIVEYTQDVMRIASEDAS